MHIAPGKNSASGEGKDIRGARDRKTVAFGESLPKAGWPSPDTHWGPGLFSRRLAVNINNDLDLIVTGPTARSRSRCW